MNAAGVIVLTGAHGVTLTAKAKHIIARSVAKLTPELRDAIRNPGSELLKVLTNDGRPAKLDPAVGQRASGCVTGRECSVVSFARMH
jgi:hypothetical protein